MIVIILITFLSGTCFAQDQDWNESVFWEEGQNFHYTGVATGSDVQEAMTQAYNEAIKEAVRHNFGYEQKLVENFYQTLQDESFQQENYFETQMIQLNGIKPGRVKVLEKDGGNYIVYREIVYPRNEIKKEQRRLRSIKPEEVIQTFTPGQSVNGAIEIFSKPSGARIVLSNKDFQISGSTQASFKLPLGRYELTAHKPGYRPFKDEVIVSGVKTRRNYKLEKLTGEIEINVKPEDALVILNSHIVDKKDLDLPVGQKHILHIEHPDYFSQTHEFDVLATKKKKLNFSLRPRPSSISLFSVPDRADVYIDNVKVGKTPLDLEKIESGNRRIRIEREGYESVKFVADILPSSHQSLEVVQLAEKEEGLISSENLHSGHAIEMGVIYNSTKIDGLELTGISAMAAYEFHLFKHLAVFGRFSFGFLSPPDKNQRSENQYSLQSQSFEYGVKILFSDQAKKGSTGYLGVSLLNNRYTLEHEFNETKERVSREGHSVELGWRVRLSSQYDFNIYLKKDHLDDLRSMPIGLSVNYNF